MAISITGEMRQKINGALADGYPCFVGTASADGKPQISMRGSVAVYDDRDAVLVGARDALVGG